MNQLKIVHTSYQNLGNGQIRRTYFNESELSLGYLDMPTDLIQKKYLTIRGGEIMLAHKNRKGEECGFMPVKIVGVFPLPLNKDGLWVVSIIHPFINNVFNQIDLIGDPYFGEWEDEGEDYQVRKVSLDITIDGLRAVYVGQERHWCQSKKQLEAYRLAEEFKQAVIKDHEEKVMRVLDLIRYNPRMGLNARLLGRMKRVGHGRLASAEQAVIQAWVKYYSTEALPLTERDLMALPPRNLLPTAVLPIK
jgi:hypothetical protein